MKLDLALQPKQLDVARIFNTTGHHAPTWIGYGGALGGGKSGLMRRLMLQRRFQYPNTKGVIIRRVFDELRQNHIDKLWEEYPQLRKYYKESTHEITLPNGSVFGFMYAENLTDVMRKFPGPEFYDIFVDQAEQFTEQELMELKKRVRWPDTPLGNCKFGLFFNPGGPGMEFLRRIFWLRHFIGAEDPEDYHFTQAFGWDNYQWFTDLMSQEDFYALSNEERFNLFITKTQYGKSLNALPQHQRVGALMGSFEEFSGQYFAGAWDASKCVIPKSLADELIRPYDTRWMAQDWGFGDHDAHGWFATRKLSPTEWVKHFGGTVDYPVDIVILYRENVIAERAEADLMNDIIGMTPEPERKYIQRFFLSQDAFGQKAKQGGEHTVGLQFSAICRRHGMPSPEPAHQERINGWRFMYQCLRQSHLRGANIDAERVNQGPVFFISSDCPEAISRTPLAIRDEDDNEDVARVPGAIWEDVTDMMRYGLYSMLGPRTKAPVEVRAREVYQAYEDPTSRALALRQFHENERRGRVISRGRRGR